MKPARIRYLLVLFMAMFLANNAVAAVRACMVQMAAQSHTAVQVLDAGGGDGLCPESNQATNCLPHCAESYKSDEQKSSFDAHALAIAPPLAQQLFEVPFETRRIVLVSAPPVVGPPLTILFGNLRI